jgi:hypothetical protein
MTYRQYTDHVKVCTYLDKDVSCINKEVRHIFEQICNFWDGMDMVVIDEYDPYTIIFHRNNYLYMKYNTKNKVLFCIDNAVMPFFNKLNYIDYSEYNSLMGFLTEDYLKYHIQRCVIISDMFSQQTIENLLKISSEK